MAGAFILTGLAVLVLKEPLKKLKSLWEQIVKIPHWILGILTYFLRHSAEPTAADHPQTVNDLENHTNSLAPSAPPPDPAN